MRTEAPRRYMAMFSAVSALALAACTPSSMDWDLRNPGAGLNTSGVSRQATADRPRADDRGVISYPGYQVVVARRGDTVTSVAARLGISPAGLGRQNAIAPDVPLRAGEILVLPARVEEPSPATGAPMAGPIQPPERVDVTTIASGAIDRAQREAPAAQGAAAQPQPGREPVRHRVARGETVYSIARLYNVPTRAIADWNGLGTDLTLREGQTLLIPPVVTTAAAAPPPPATAPGQGSPTPEPPSAAQPLPAETPAPASAPTPVPASPALGSSRTAASSAQFAMPADGRIIRAYEKGKYDGIGIGAAVGSPVRAATDGTVAAITRDTDQVPIIVISHPNNMLTVYANVDGITVAKDARVRRGQQIATVRAGSPAFLHFEVRKGYESVDPMPYLQ